MLLLVRCRAKKPKHKSKRRVPPEGALAVLHGYAGGRGRTRAIVYVGTKPYDLYLDEFELVGLQPKKLEKWRQKFASNPGVPDV